MRAKKAAGESAEMLRDGLAEEAFEIQVRSSAEPGDLAPFGLA